MLKSDEKKKVLNRIKRINGQVEAVGRMIDDEEYCVDVLMQISAATGALAKVGQIVLENHLKTCVMEAMKNDDDETRRMLLCTSGSCSQCSLSSLPGLHCIKLLHKICTCSQTAS